MRPRLLLIPTLTQLEWANRPLLEGWADVAAYDAPGVGDEPPGEGLHSQATARRGLAELDRLGWDRCIVVADEIGSLAAVRLARERPQAVEALVLGHPILSFDMESDRRPLNEAVVRAHVQLAGASFRAFVREQFRAWMGMYGKPADDADAQSERYLERVRPEVAAALFDELLDEAGRYLEEVGDALRGLPDVPTLLVEHDGCLMFTPEGFEDAAAALPHAETASTHAKPSVDPAFCDILRTFAARIGG